MAGIFNPQRALELLQIKANQVGWNNLNPFERNVLGNGQMSQEQADELEGSLKQFATTSPEARAAVEGAQIKTGQDAVPIQAAPTPVNPIAAPVEARFDPAVRAVIDNFSRGGISLQDAMSQLGSRPGGQEALLTDPQAGSLAAQASVLNDQVQGRLFGTDGGSLLSQSLADRTKYGDLASKDYERNLEAQSLMNEIINKDLKGRDESYGLQDSDLKAYAQAQANTQREFSGAEQNLLQSLQSRGLLGSQSGASATGYAGLYGTKNEQLAEAQRKIASDRIATAMQLAQARLGGAQALGALTGTMYGQNLGQKNFESGLASQLGQQYEGSKQNQFLRQMGGAEHGFNEALAGRMADMNQQQIDATNRWNQWAADQRAQQSSFSNILGNLFTTGLGAAAGSVLGPVGAAAGGSLANSLFNKPKV